MTIITAILNMAHAASRNDRFRELCKLYYIIVMFNSNL